MNYLSVCSGIEAATCAWESLGWYPVGFSEIELFPCSVLHHHYPKVLNYGDINEHAKWKLPSIDLLVGGTPCQSFSIAGLRKGLKDSRGNIMLTYLRVVESRRPKWVVWENVPGVLSSNRGRDFSTFITSLGNMGYGWAYRVLDAQWFGVAQRRKRVFVVGCLGDSISAAKVLFESESVSRNPAPSREKGQGSSTNVADCLRSGGSGGVPSSRREHLVYHAPITGTLAAVDGPKGVSDQYAHEGKLTVWRGSDNTNAETCINHAGTLTCDRGQRGGIIATAFHPTQDPINSKNISHSLGVGSKNGCATVAVAIGTDCYNGTITGDVACTMGTPGSSVNASGPTIMHQMAVRRLTPIECERLQGFPDNYTAIPWRKKLADQCPDGPRYKALGNSMAVPVMRWIGERINNMKD